MKRSDIENRWIEVSESWGTGLGVPLCVFTKRMGLGPFWDEVWDPREGVTLASEYFGGEIEEDWGELTYLTRALSLNMLLDDIEHLLEKE